MGCGADRTLKGHRIMSGRVDHPEPPDQLRINSGSRPNHVRITSGSPDDIGSRREHVRIERPDVVTGMSLRITDALSVYRITSGFVTSTHVVSP